MAPVSQENRKEYQREYYLAHREQCNLNSKKWRINNLEKARKVARDSAARNKGKYTDRVKQYKSENRNKINKYRRKFKKFNKSLWIELIKKRGMDRCSICGYEKCFAAIDFHHKIPQEKESDINRLFYEKPTPKRIAELEKCIAVCANCHREIHWSVGE